MQVNNCGKLFEVDGIIYDPKDLNGEHFDVLMSTTTVAKDRNKFGVKCGFIATLTTLTITGITMIIYKKTKKFKEKK